MILENRSAAPPSDCIVKFKPRVGTVFGKGANLRRSQPHSVPTRTSAGIADRKSQRPASLERATAGLLLLRLLLLTSLQLLITSLTLLSTPVQVWLRRLLLEIL